MWLCAHSRWRSRSLARHRAHSELLNASLQGSRVEPQVPGLSGFAPRRNTGIDQDARMMTQQRATDAEAPRQLHSGAFPAPSKGASRSPIEWGRPGRPVWTRPWHESWVSRFILPVVARWHKREVSSNRLTVIPHSVYAELRLQEVGHDYLHPPNDTRHPVVSCCRRRVCATSVRREPSRSHSSSADHCV